MFIDLKTAIKITGKSDSSLRRLKKENKIKYHNSGGKLMLDLDSLADCYKDKRDIFENYKKNKGNKTDMNKQDYSNLVKTIDILTMQLVQKDNRLNGYTKLLTNNNEEIKIKNEEISSKKREYIKIVKGIHFKYKIIIFGLGSLVIYLFVYLLVEKNILNLTLNI